MKQRVKNWINENGGSLGIRSDFKLIEIRRGESNHVFKLKAEEEMLHGVSEAVIRTTKGLSEDRISNEADMLEFLENENIENVPRKIYADYLDEIAQFVLVETSVGQKDKDLEELNEIQYKNFIKKLAEIHSIDAKSYNSFFGTDEPQKVTMKYRFQDVFEEYSKGRYEEYSNIADKVDSRVEKLYEKQKKLYKRMASVEGKIPWRLVHGDAAGNIRVSGDEVFIVDWEFSKLGVPMFELIYIFRHNELSNKQRRRFLNEYKKHRKPPKLVEDYADEWERFLAFNDVIWTALRKEKIKRKGEDASEYADLLEKRIEKLNEMHKNNEDIGEK